MAGVESQFELSPSWLRQLLGTVDALILVLDLQGRVVLFNGVCEEVSGHSFEALRGQQVWDVLFPPEERGEVLNQFHALVESGGETVHEGDWIAADGSSHGIVWKTTCLKDPEGQVAYIAGTGIEFSALKASEARYRWLSSQTVEGVAHHRGGVLVDVNARCCEMFGYPHAEMVGRPVIEFATPESAKVILQRIRDHLVGPYEVEGLRKDGSVFPLEIVTREAGPGDGSLRVAGLRDVSERHKLEQERELATEQLHRAQRMQTVGLLAGGIAHDFNNLLSVVLGSAELALQSVAPHDPVGHQLHRIHDAAEMAATLTRQLLVFGGKDTPTPEVLDVRETVLRLQDLIEGVVGEAIAVDLRLDPREACVFIARPHLEQVVVNLVVNAGAAMEPGGCLRIRTQPVTLRRDLTTSVGQTLPAADYVLLEIEDDGHGMPSSVAKQALEPFFTTRPGGHGTGLGLSVVYSIVTACGGGLELDTSPETGTRWRIYFPSTTADAVAEEAVEEMHVRPTGTVLVVEDEADVRDLLVAALESGGYRVFAADGAEQALVLFGRHERQIRLLLSDVVMPEVTGPELANRIRETHPSLPVLFISGYSQSALERHGLGGAPLIQKPFRIRDLLSRVGEMMDGQALDA